MIYIDFEAMVEKTYNSKLSSIWHQQTHSPKCLSDESRSKNNYRDADYMEKRCKIFK